MPVSVSAQNTCSLLLSLSASKEAHSSSCIVVVEIAVVKQFTVKVVAEAVAVAAVGSGIRSSSSRSSSSHRKGSFSREVFPGGIPPCPLVAGPLGALEGTPYGLHHSLHHIYMFICFICFL